ncbi:MAG: GTP-binding protein [Alphaproteobacteria bacterium 32-64-14]|nr:MAG: GTP-binding protein [Alphaproteobacteria bacterium 32-64-14]
MQEATTVHGRAEQTIAGVEVEAGTLELRRAENAERNIRDDIAKLSRDKRDLEIELRTLDRDGIGEKLDEVSGQLERAQAHLGRVELEAAASQLLVDTLQQAQRDTKDRWLAPLRQRIQPYLRLVQPDGDVVLNEETLEIDQFVRKGVGEPFTGLSVGAREQIAVITRIGLAELLLAAGQPATLVLDDALVNTDEPRLGRMHLVLQKAAENLQVLVFTCRERDFIHLGAPIRRVS